MAKELKPSPQLAEAILKLLNRCPNPVSRGFLDRQLMRNVSPKAVDIMNDTLLALHFDARIHKMFLDPHQTPGYNADLFKDTSVYVWLPSKEFIGFTDIPCGTDKFYVGASVTAREVINCGFKIYSSPSEQANALSEERRVARQPSMATPTSKQLEETEDGDEGECEGEGGSKDEDINKEVLNDESIKNIRALQKSDVLKPKPVIKETTPPAAHREVAKQKEGSLDYRIVEFLKSQTDVVTKKEVVAAFPDVSYLVVCLRLGYLINGRAVFASQHEDKLFRYWVHPTVTSMVPVEIIPKERKTPSKVSKKQQAALDAQAKQQEMDEKAIRDNEEIERQQKEKVTVVGLAKNVATNLELAAVIGQPDLNTKHVKVKHRKSIDDAIDVHLMEDDTEISFTNKGHIKIISGDVKIRFSGEAARIVQQFMKTMPTLTPTLALTTET